MRRVKSVQGLLVAALLATTAPVAADEANPLWDLYEQTFKTAKYIDLTHAFEPVQAVWPGFGRATFKAAVAGADLGDYASVGDEFTYEKHGFALYRIAGGQLAEAWMQEDDQGYQQQLFG